MRGLNQRIAFAVGIGIVFFVLVSTFTDAARQLFAFHMTQHLLLIAVAAPLLAISRSLEGLENKHWMVRQMLNPILAWMGFVGIFLFWHWPTAFRWAAGSKATELLEEASILAAALFFWTVALASADRARLSYGARALFVMTAAVTTDLPGVIMVFSSEAFCSMPGEYALRWGLSPLEDQHIAGMLMWVPANLIFFSIAMWLFARWMMGTSVSPLPPLEHR